MQAETEATARDDAREIERAARPYSHTDPRPGGAHARADGPIAADARTQLGERGEWLGIAYAWDARANTYNVIRPPRFARLRYLMAERPNGRARTVVRLSLTNTRTARAADPTTYVRTVFGVYVEQRGGMFDGWMRAPQRRDARADAERATFYARRWAGCMRAAAYVAHACPRERRAPRTADAPRYDGPTHTLTDATVRMLARSNALTTADDRAAHARERVALTAERWARIVAREPRDYSHARG